MKSIEIVSHCHSIQFPYYAWALHYQLSSVVLDRPECKVIVTVVTSSDDGNVEAVLSRFRSHVSGDFRIKKLYLDVNHLGRRAFGRNLAASNSEADVVWFSDVDQAFRHGILDRLARMEWPENATMIFPERILIHKDHATGDEELVRASCALLPIDIDEHDFVPKKYNRAIGGVQIVRGACAREHGYLRENERWLRPVEDGKFAACRCDVPYRRFCGTLGRVVGVDLPGLYRLRHSQSSHGRTPRL